MVKRIRVRKNSPNSPSKADQEILDNLVDSYVSNEAEIAKLIAGNKRLLEEVGITMKRAGVVRHGTRMGEAKYETPTSRSKTIIDPHKFMDIVQKVEDFFECITVSITKARMVVSERELDSVSTKITPEPKPPVLVIKQIKA